jgi:hypothetical protein
MSIEEVRKDRKQCPTHGHDLEPVDRRPGAPIVTMHRCPDPLCGYDIRLNRFHTFSEKE